MDNQDKDTDIIINDPLIIEDDLHGLVKRKIFDPASDIYENSKNANKKSVHWEIQQISKLTLRHSIAYIGKFLFLNIIVLLPSCILSETVTSMIISSLTFLGCLLFDQIISFINLKDFDFIKTKKFCFGVFVYIMILCFVNIDLLIFQSYISSIVDLSKYKITAGLVLFSSTISVLTEAIMNIPQQAMPTSQEQINK